MYQVKNPLLFLILLLSCSAIQAQLPDRPAPPKPLFLEKAAHQGDYRLSRPVA